MVALLTRPLRGVERRQAEAFQLLHDDHDNELVPLFSGVIAVAHEKDFVKALMEDLKTSDWQQRLLARNPNRLQNVAELQQPIHREFSVALYEARCRVPGKPRLDPRKIAAQGMVVRKFRGTSLLAWKYSKAAQRGWLPVGTHDDPSGMQPATTGNSELDKLLAKQNPVNLLHEDIAPLYVAPPDVCAALGKTVLFGVVPVTSSEQTETETIDFLTLADLELANKVEGGLDFHLSSFLKPDMAPTPPPAGTPVSPDWANSDPYRPFTTAIRQLVQEAGLEDDTAEAQALRDVLSSMKILDFIRAASPILAAGKSNEIGLTMPQIWPRATPELRAAFYHALGARFKNIASHVGRYDERDAVYQLTAFIRVRCGACPPKLVWCETPSQFKIAPWWQGSGPQMRIPLPDFNLSNLTKLKPNVSFEVPKSLAKFLNQDFSGVLKNPPKEGTETGIDWICSFSIPIITICAFILLSIILALLNIVFFWLPLVKICLPFPKVKQT